MDKVNLAAKFSLLGERLSPKIVGTLDDYEVKLAKLEGEFVWHRHDRDDEMSLVVDGRMSMDFRDRTIDLEHGDFPIIPKGIGHRPRANEECRVVLFECAGVLNIGDAPQGAFTRNSLDRI